MAFYKLYAVVDALGPCCLHSLHDLRSNNAVRALRDALHSSFDRGKLRGEPEGERRKWPKCWYRPVDDPAAVGMALRFTLSRPVTAAVGPSHAELLWFACEPTDCFTPMSEDEESGIVATLGGEPIFQS